MYINSNFISGCVCVCLCVSRLLADCERLQRQLSEGKELVRASQRAYVRLHGQWRNACAQVGRERDYELLLFSFFVC